MAASVVCWSVPTPGVKREALLVHTWRRYCWPVVRSPSVAVITSTLLAKPPLASSTRYAALRFTNGADVEPSPSVASSVPGDSVKVTLPTEAEVPPVRNSNESNKTPFTVVEGTPSSPMV
ncbi:MAG: hypothetical protein ACKON7_05300 [Planctomycetaceae bacterium]